MVRNQLTERDTCEHSLVELNINHDSRLTSRITLRRNELNQVCLESSAPLARALIDCLCSKAQRRFVENFLGAIGREENTRFSKQTPWSVRSEQGSAYSVLFSPGMFEADLFKSQRKSCFVHEDSLLRFWGVAEVLHDLYLRYAQAYCSICQCEVPILSPEKQFQKFLSRITGPGVICIVIGGEHLVPEISALKCRDYLEILEATHVILDDCLCRSGCEEWEQILDAQLSDLQKKHSFLGAVVKSVAFPLSPDAEQEIVSLFDEVGQNHGLDYRLMYFSKESKAAIEHVYVYSDVCCPSCKKTFEPLTSADLALQNSKSHCLTCQGRGVGADTDVCPECLGTGLEKALSDWRLGGLSIGDVSKTSARELGEWLQGLHRGHDLSILSGIEKLEQALSALDWSYLSALPVGLRVAALSSYERLLYGLGTVLFLGLSDLIILLPLSIQSLCRADRGALHKLLRKIAQCGNSVLVLTSVCNAEDSYDRSFVLDLESHSLVLEGLATSDSEQGKCAFNSSTRTTSVGGATAAASMNYSNLNLAYKSKRFFPDKALICISGPIGSGKSRLLLALQQEFKTQVSALKHYGSVKLIMHKGLGRKAAETLGAKSALDSLFAWRFAQTFQARLQGYREDDFLPNKSSLKCAFCLGLGSVQEHSLEDAQCFGLESVAQLECPVCMGRRFKSALLRVRLNGHSVAEIAQLTLAELRVLFSNDSELYQHLDAYCSFGLGAKCIQTYVSELDIAEGQLLDLCRQIGLSITKGRSRSKAKAILYLVDECFSGLPESQFQDSFMYLRKLIELNHTVLFVDNTQRAQEKADHLITLASEGLGSSRTCRLLS